MKKMTGSEKGWFAIIVALWVILLAAMIFVPSRSGGASAAGGAAGSLQATLAEVEPSTSEAVVAHEIDMMQAYGDRAVAMLPLCADEPKELADQKLQASPDIADEINLSSGNNYMLLASGESDGFDDYEEIPADVVDLCNGAAFQQPVPVEQPLPFYWDGNVWRFGASNMPQ